MTGKFKPTPCPLCGSLMQAPVVRVGQPVGEWEPLMLLSVRIGGAWQRRFVHWRCFRKSIPPEAKRAGKQLSLWEG